MRFLGLVIIVGCLLASASRAEKRTSFKDLAVSMLRNNNLIIQSKTNKEQAKIGVQQDSRFNAPVLEASVFRTNLNYSQQKPSEIDYTQDADNYSLGVTGKFPIVGVNYELGYQSIQTDQTNYTGNPDLDISNENYSLGLQIDLLENAGFLIGRFLFDEQELSYRLADATYKRQVQDSLLNLISLYVRVSVAEEKLEKTQQFRQQAAELFKSYEQLYKEGEFSRVELLSSNIQLNNQITSILNLEFIFKQVKRELLTFTGGYDEASINQDMNFVKLPRQFLERIDRVKSRLLLENSPDLIVLEKQIKLSKLRVRAFENQMLPTLKVGGQYQKSTNPSFQPLTGVETDIDNWSVGLSLSLPLDNSEARANLQNEKVQKKYLGVQKEVLEKNISLAVAGIKSEIQNLRNQLEIVDKNRIMAARRYDSALPLVKLNSASRIDILFYQNELISIEYAYIDLNALLLIRRAELAYATGMLSLKNVIN